MPVIKGQHFSLKCDITDNMFDFDQTWSDDEHKGKGNEQNKQETNNNN